MTEKDLNIAEKGETMNETEEEEVKNVLHAQILSDLHLEFKGAFDDVESLIPTKSEILILAGDIGNIKFRYYELFFDWAAKNFKHILYVAGNHEYYFFEYNEVQRNMKECLSKYPNVHFLHRKRIEINDTVFLGVTLWMNPPPSKRQTIQTMYNDFKQIQYKVRATSSEGKEEEIIRNLRLRDTMRMHEEDKKFLSNELTRVRNEARESGKKKKVVIISHHVPLRGLKFLRSRERHPLYRDVMYGTCADCSKLILEFFDEIDVWIHGHSHNSLITSYTRAQIIEETKRMGLALMPEDISDEEEAEEEFFDEESKKEEIHDRSELRRLEEEEEEKIMKKIKEEVEEEENQNQEERRAQKKERIWLISNQIGYPHQRDILYRKNYRLPIPPPRALKREEIPDPEIYTNEPSRNRVDSEEEEEEEEDQENDNHPFSGGGNEEEDEGGNKIKNFISGMRNFLFGDGGGGFSEYSEEDTSVLIRREETKEGRMNE